MPTKDGKLVIVYDVDDVLNNLNDVVFDILGIDIKAQSRFKIHENIDSLGPDDMDRIVSAYGNPDIFRKVSFVPGAKLIYEAEENGKAEVRIRSSNISQEIADIKTQQLLSGIPGISEDKITMFCGLTTVKTIDPEADIVIEDSLENLLRYSRDTTRILVDKPYNQFGVYGVHNYIEKILRVHRTMDAVIYANILAQA